MTGEAIFLASGYMLSTAISLGTVLLSLKMSNRTDDLRAAENRTAELEKEKQMSEVEIAAAHSELSDRDRMIRGLEKALADEKRRTHDIFEALRRHGVDPGSVIDGLLSPDFGEGDPDPGTG